MSDQASYVQAHGGLRDDKAELISGLPIMKDLMYAMQWNRGSCTRYCRRK